MKNEFRLKQERIRRGWTQSYIASELGVSPQAVCDWEKGRTFPRRPVLDNLEALFNLRYQELFVAVSEDESFSSTN